MPVKQRLLLKHKDSMRKDVRVYVVNAFGGFYFNILKMLSVVLTEWNCAHPRWYGMELHALNLILLFAGYVNNVVHKTSYISLRNKL